MRNFFAEFMAAVRVSPRLFFAPLVGAFCGVRDEWNHVRQKLDHPAESAEIK
jgi:hypothetical protein